MYIRNPVEWSLDQLKFAGTTIETLVAGRGARPEFDAQPAIRRIGFADIKEALAKGLEDFVAFRDDVVLICIVYPVAGLILARFAFGDGLLPLVFPLASGFALIGPFAAVLLYEMSRRREQGLDVSWGDGFSLVHSPALGAILVLGLALMALFLLWLGAAWGIYALTLGPEPPASIGSFVRDVLTTERGWAMIVIGIGVGFLFAVVALAVGVVSFPLLVDRQTRLATAVKTSVNAVIANPGTMALWGLVVAGSLVLGSIPLLVGLIVVMPVLGHATWHLYRKVIAID